MELNRRLVAFYSVGLLGIVATFIGLLLSINAYLSIQTASLAEQIAAFQTSPRTRAIQSMELTVGDFTEFAKRIQNVKRTLVPLHPILPDIERSIPSGITVNGISLDTQNNKGTIVGFAAVRNDVVAFKENLEKLPWISLVDSPISNIIRERDITFSFGITTKFAP